MQVQMIRRGGKPAHPLALSSQVTALGVEADHRLAVQGDLAVQVLADVEALLGALSVVRRSHLWEAAVRTRPVLWVLARDLFVPPVSGNRLVDVGVLQLSRGVASSPALKLSMRGLVPDRSRGPAAQGRSIAAKSLILTGKYGRSGEI